MLLVVVSLTWGLIRLAPGNFYSGERNSLRPSKEHQGKVRARQAVVRPVRPHAVQYRSRRFRESLKYPGTTVNAILGATLPVSATLGVLAYLLALVVGITAGTIAALRQNTRVDYASMAVAMLGISMPTSCSDRRSCSSSRSVGTGCRPRAGRASVSTWCLPVLTLSAVYMAYIASLTRSGMLEVLRSNYIRTARAKGLSERRRHRPARRARRTAAGRLILRSGAGLPDFRHRRGRAHFALPGLGNYFINANLNRDEPLIIGIVAFMSIAVLVFNLLVDVATPFSIRASVTDHGSVAGDPGSHRAGSRGRHVALEGCLQAAEEEQARGGGLRGGLHSSCWPRSSAHGSSSGRPATPTTTSPPIRLS
jgi:oligopeptide transport system permease protein